jgi:hypothetical protein
MLVSCSATLKNKKCYATSPAQKCRVTEILAQHFSQKNATLRTMVEQGCRVTLLMEACHGALFTEKCRAVFSIFAALLGAQDDVNSGVGDDWLAAHLTDLQSKGGILNITDYQSLMFYEMLGEECCIQKGKSLQTKNPPL